MPLYEFDCPGCYPGDFRKELFLPMAQADQPQVCPECRHPLVRRFSVPQVQTASTFQGMNGGLGGAQFKHPEVRQHYLDQARKGGVNPEGKFYEGRIARFPGDPEAWVQSRDDVRGVLERRGWGCDGDVKVKAEAAPPPADVPIAPELVEDLVEARLEKQFGEDFTEVKGKAVEQAREDVLNTNVPNWS